MKILFLVGQKVDYLQDLTYSGLKEILGNDAVIDWPWFRPYHSKKFGYPENLGYMGNGPKYSMEEMIDKVKAHEFDLVIVPASKRQCFVSLHTLSPWLKDVPIIFFDSSDYPEIGSSLTGIWDNKFLKIFQIIFKREFNVGTNLGEWRRKIYPISFSINLSAMKFLPVPEKDKDVVFFGHINSVSRQLLQKRFPEWVPRDGISFRGPKYFQEIARRKIGLSFRGGGWDTLRYWEIPWCHAMLISEHLDIHICSNFVHNCQAVFVRSDLLDLKGTVEYYLSHNDEREEIAKNGFIHATTYHTNKERAKYILEILKVRGII